MKEFNYIISDPVGFHAKPARKLVELMNTIDSKVYLCTDTRKVEATKLIRMISLGLVTGSSVKIVIEGGNEEKSFAILKDFFSNNV